jgi:predicted lipid-binding transport protein (Tim44 family)
VSIKPKRGALQRLNRVKALAAESVAEKDLARLNFLTAEEFVSYLEELDARAATKEQTVRGYNVKVKYNTVNEAEKKARKKVIAETVLQALRKMNSAEKKD